MGRRRGSHWSTRAERDEIRRRVARGERLDDVAVAVGRTKRHVQLVVSPYGGIQPRPTARSPLRLSDVEREEISRGLSGGASLRRIARGLGRAPSTVSREVAANGGRGRYRAYWPKSGRSAAPVGRAGPSSPPTPDSDGRWSGSWRPAGRRSRSPGSCATIILTNRSCGCRTRRSTSRSSCRAGAPCAQS